MKKNYRISMKKFAEAIKEKIEDNYDVNILVDGPRGNGKSTFMYKLFAQLGDFIPERDIVFSREDLIERMRLKYGLIMQDEMINAAHNREFYNKEQLQLIKMLNMYRDNYNITAGAVPFFYDLDPQVRKFYAVRVTIVDRGKAILQKPGKSLFSNDPWETDLNKKIELTMRRTKKGKNMVNFRKLTTFWGTLEFGALSKKQEARYHKIKERKRNKMMGEEEPDKVVVVDDVGIITDKFDGGKITRDQVKLYCSMRNIDYRNFSKKMSAFRVNKQTAMLTN
jgi:hypothetical protein